MLVPFRSLRTNSGAFLLTSVSAAKAVTVAEQIPNTALAMRSLPVHVRVLKIAPLRADVVSLEFLLVAALNRIPLVSPVGSEVVRQVESLDAGEPKVAEKLHGRCNVRAAIPRATAAIEHDEGLAL